MTSGEKFGKYTLINKIADGGMAEVFLAVVTSVGGFEKRVALKKILPSFSRDESFVHSFVNEARICGQLHHPNVVQVYGFDRIDDYLCLAMEFIEGLDLERIITHRLLERKLIPPSIAAEIVLQMLDGLDYAHTATSMDNEPLNIVHRDLKPSNILIDRSGVIKIVDFGVAKASTNLYKTMNVGTAKGTVSYMSPEQASGRLDLGPASDVFGVGSILYELLTLRRLFDGENLFMILDEVRSAPLDKFFARIPREVPEGLVRVLRKALERDLSRRYRTAADMARDIRTVFPDLQGPVLLARFVEELVASGMTIAGLSSAGSAVTDPAVGAAPETRAEFPVEEGDPDSTGELGSFDLARLGIPPLRDEAGAPGGEGGSPSAADRGGGMAVRREELATVPSELPGREVRAPRSPSPASILRSSTVSSPRVIADDEPTPVERRGPRKAVPDAGPVVSVEDEVTPVTRERRASPDPFAPSVPPSYPRAPGSTAGSLEAGGMRGASSSGARSVARDVPGREEVPDRPGLEPSWSDRTTDSALDADPFRSALAGSPGGHEAVASSDGPAGASGGYPETEAAIGHEPDWTGPGPGRLEPGSEQAPPAASDPGAGAGGAVDDWSDLATESLASPEDDELHDAVSWLYSQPRIDVGAAEGQTEDLGALPEPLADVEVESLLDQPPSWSEVEQARPFGAPLPRVAPEPDIQREQHRQAHLRQLRVIRYILTVVAAVLVAAAVWTHFGLKPTIQELIFPSAPTQITVVVEDPPSWGEVLFVGDPEVVEVRRGMFHVRLSRKAAYELKVVGPHWESRETYRVVIDPDDPATWRIRRRFTRTPR